MRTRKHSYQREEDFKMATVKELISEINANRRSKDGVAYNTKSQKDEINVMRTMLNDDSYVIDVYNSNGEVEGQYCPAKEVKGMISSILTDVTELKSEESERLIGEYEFKNSDAKAMINIGKEFINTYLETGRKMSLGGRERSNISIIRKTVPAGVVKYPVKVGEDKNGKAICESKESHVAGYDSIKVYAPCPSWRKKKDSKK